jgi:lipoyl(octanoyl) transferase
MAHFGTIVPCGIADRPVTSLAALLGDAPPMAEAMSRFEAAFFARFEAVNA